MALCFLYYKGIFSILYTNLYFSSQLRQKSKDFLYAGWETGYLSILISHSLQRWRGIRLVNCKDLLYLSCSCSSSIHPMDYTLKVLSSCIECFAQVSLGTSVWPTTRRIHYVKSKSLLNGWVIFLGGDGCHNLINQPLLFASRSCLYWTQLFPNMVGHYPQPHAAEKF